MMMMTGGWVRDYGLFTTLFLFLARNLSLMDERKHKINEQMNHRIMLDVNESKKHTVTKTFGNWHGRWDHCHPFRLLGV